MDKGTLIRLATNFQKDILIDKQINRSRLDDNYTLENTFLLRLWSPHHSGIFLSVCYLSGMIKVKKKKKINQIYLAQGNWLRPNNIEKYCWSATQTWCIKSKTFWILPPFKSDTYPSQQNFAKVSFPQNS